MPAVLCPTGLLVALIAHLILTSGELVIMISHRDPLYFVLVVGDLLLAGVLGVKVLRTRKPAGPNSKHNALLSSTDDFRADNHFETRKNTS